MRFFDTKHPIYKALAVTLLVVMLNELVFPSVAMALTSGPSQPEVQSFEPAGTNQMVDLFTGDFTYNIPLLDVEGYPINIAYHGNITMDQEASWVGLGWNINPGSMNRAMRGIPDDFDGDQIEKNYKIKVNQLDGATWGGGTTVGGSIPLDEVGIPQTNLNISQHLEMGIGSMTHSYKGIGYLMKFDTYTSVGLTTLRDISPINVGVGGGIGVELNTLNGIDFNPSVSFNAGIAEPGGSGISASQTFSTPYNSRQGLKQINISSGLSVNASVGPVSMGVAKGGGSYIALGTQTYVPSVPFNTLSYGTNTKHLMGVYGGVSIGENASVTAWAYGYKEKYSTTSAVIEESVTSPSYGYNNLENAVGNPAAMMDFNREKDWIFTENTPNLPAASHTYDVFMATAQGLGGAYRPHRNDIGSVADPSKVVAGTYNNKHKEDGVGILYHNVRSKGTTKSTSHFRQWDDPDNGALEYLEFFKKGEQDSLAYYEPVYYSKTGENTEYPKSFYDNYGNETPSKLELSKNGDEITLLNKIIKHPYKNSGGTTLGTINRRTERQTRSELLSYLTAEQAEEGGLVKQIESYQAFSTGGSENGLSDTTFIDRTNGNRQNHHISEVSVTRNDGQRFVYGIPAYNYTQEEVSFNVSGETTHCSKNLVEYTHDGSTPDNSMDNEKGRDNFFSKVTTPAYAYSYLLTSVLSPDYVDVNGNGPSEDDLGNYTKVNYTLTHPSFNWRIPYSEDDPASADFPRAQYNERFKTDDEDDIGSYIYGEKEVWYIHSIESKNYVAEFYVSDRQDAYGVEDENGELNTGDAMHKLDSIKLFNKEDRYSNGTSATPIKSVHFEYNYSLCDGVPNNNAATGKLTLTKIYFTYGNSRKGRLSPYEFTYDQNYSYSPTDVDRWGYYKSQTSCSSPNSEFPYSIQNEATANTNSRAWQLSTITLPSGGEIDVTYESDDYAYVQNKQAMQMFKVKATGFSFAYSAGEERLFSGKKPYNYIFFDLQEQITGSSISAKKEFREKYLSFSSPYVYYKCLVDISGNGDYEYVPGYAEILDYGLAGGGSPYSIGWIKLKGVEVTDGNANKDETNPIARSGWQFTRSNLPRIIYPEIDESDCNNPVGCFMKAMATLGIDIQGIMKGGLNKALRDNNFSYRIDKDNSWIRLLNPIKQKFGGGSRVQKITTTDSWASLGGESSETYGQTYEYTMEEDGETISSGVASYEPMIGNDENPFRNPKFFKVENVMFPDDHHYQETPYGESSFPAPVVGYSKVTVKNLSRTGVSRNATGQTVHEFYTYRDFPTRWTKTSMDVKNSNYRPGFIGQISGDRQINYIGASQGFVVINNDMHGKPKSVQSFSEADSKMPVNSIKYNYYSKTRKGKPVNELLNEVTTIDDEGNVSTTVLAQDMDIVVDQRYSEQTTDVFVSGTATDSPILSHSKSVYEQYDSKRFHSAVITKVINQYGLLKSTEVFEDGTTTIQRNLAWDKETGQVLLTSVDNEFRDPVYSLTYPAYWAYDRMGPAYKNIGTTFFDVNISSGSATINDADEHFVPGDVILVEGSTTYPLWVLDVNGTDLDLIQEDGTLAATENNTKFTIIRSGRRNQQSVPMAQISTLKDPTSGATISEDSVLNATAFEYAEEWAMFCGDSTGFAPSITICDSTNECAGEGPCTDCTNSTGTVDEITCGVKVGDEEVNPYLLGLRGNWRLNKSYSYYTNRVSPLASTSTDVRDDGTFEGYTPFWDVASNTWYPIYDINHPSYDANDLYENWSLNNEVTIYHPNGYVLESKDVLDRYSSTIYSYNDVNQTLPIAVASNAKYKQIAFDGFEDYDYMDHRVECNLPGHFNYERDFLTNLDNNTFHTGKTSIRVLNGSKFVVSRFIRDCSTESAETGTGYVVQPCDCITRFSPDSGKYVVSAWIKEQTTSPVTTYSDAYIEIELKDETEGSLSTETFYASGPIIDGWQRIEGVFDISPDAANIDVKLRNGSGDFMFANFDDIRIQPYSASMRTMVYDPESLRIMAELDEYNFATFYEYDEEGDLVRVKKETVKGIITLNEQKSSLRKQ